MWYMGKGGLGLMHSVCCPGDRYWRARTPQAGFRAMQLNDDCTDVVKATDTQVFTSPNREAPAFFAHAGSFYLWASGTMGWSPIQGYLYVPPWKPQGLPCTNALQHSTTFS